MQPQAFLGLTFNWGVLLGYAAVHGHLDFAAVLPLYAHGICWTLVYDTIYAHQDKSDDIVVGIKSTALLFGDNTKAYLAGFAGTSISCLALTGGLSRRCSAHGTNVAACACLHHADCLSSKQSSHEHALRSSLQVCISGLQVCISQCLAGMCAVLWHALAVTSSSLLACTITAGAGSSAVQACHASQLAQNLSDKQKATF